MHAQARCGIHFNDTAILNFEGTQHRLTHHVHATDIEADHLGSGDGAGGHFRMDVICHIGGGAAGGQVGVVPQDNAGALGGHAVSVIALLFEAGQCHFVKANLGERRRMAFATTRVCIDNLHQLFDGVLAIAGDERGLAASGGDQFVTHHQQAVVAAGQVAFHHHFGSVEVCILKSSAHVGFRGDVHRHAAPLVAIAWLDHHRTTNFLCGQPGVLGTVDRSAQGHGNASGMQELLGQVFVLGDELSNGTGAVNLGGLDAALLAAPAQLNQAAFCEAAVRNATRHGSIHDGAGGRAQANVFVELAQQGDRLIQLEGLVLKSCLTQLIGKLQGAKSYWLLGVLDNHLEQAVLGGGRGATEGDRTSRLDLQVQRGRLQRMGQGQRCIAFTGAQSADAWKQVPQTAFEPRVCRQLVLGLTAHECLDGRVTGPEIGAPQGANARNVHQALTVGLGEVADGV